MANMAASMKGQKPELKHYLRSNKLPDVYEASIDNTKMLLR